MCADYLSEQISELGVKSAWSNGVKVKAEWSDCGDRVSHHMTTNNYFAQEQECTLASYITHRNRLGQGCSALSSLTLVCPL